MKNFKNLFRIKFNQSFNALGPTDTCNANLGRTNEITNKGVFKLHTIVQSEFIKKLNPKRCLEYILKNERHFGVTFRHYQVKMKNYKV